MFCPSIPFRHQSATTSVPGVQPVELAMKSVQAKSAGQFCNSLHVVREIACAAHAPPVRAHRKIRNNSLYPINPGFNVAAAGRMVVKLGRAGRSKAAANEFDGVAASN